MAQHIVLQAAARQDSGKGAARAIRRQNQVPAVIYGMNKTPELVALTQHSVEMALQKGGFFTHIIDLNVDGTVTPVLAREAQRDPLTDKILHLDFMRFNPKAKITVTVPVELVGEESCPGVKEGGLPQLIVHELEVECRADLIPERIEVSVAGLHTNQSVHLGDIKLPEGVELVEDDKELTIATVMDTKVVEPEVTEPIVTEVITEKKSAEGDEAAAKDGKAPAKADAKPAAKK